MNIIFLNWASELNADLQHTVLAKVKNTAYFQIKKYSELLEDKLFQECFSSYQEEETTPLPVLKP